MFRFILLSSLLSINFIYSEIPTSEKEIISVVNQIIQYSHEPSFQKVWKGFDMTDSPILITFANGHTFAFNKTVNKEKERNIWQKQTLGTLKFLFSPKDYWNASPIPFQAQFNLEGERVYLFSMEPVLKGDINAFHIFIHERFHNYQFSHFTMSKEGLGQYLDQNNLENLALIQVEERLLIQFLQDSDEKRERLLDFIAVGSVRRALIDPLSVIWEDHQQVMEGLAEYVSFKILDNVPNLSPGTGAKNLISLLQRYVENNQIAERAPKLRHYGVGATLGFALDDQNIDDWKGKIERNEASLFEILKGALALTPKEINQRFMEVMIRSGFSQIYQNVQASLLAYETNLNRLVDTYQHTEGVEISITSPRRLPLSGKGSTSKQLSLPNGSNLFVEDSSVFSTADQSWRLELIKQPLVFQNRTGERKFKCKEITEIELDGRKIQMKEVLTKKMNRPFHSIKVKGKGANFFSNGNAGLISGETGKISIKFH